MKIFVPVFYLVLVSVRGFSAVATNHSLVAPTTIQITPAFVNELAEEARTNNPALLAAAARVDASRANQSSIRTWEDPMVRFGVLGANEEMRKEDGDIIYGVDQKLPLFGKPKAARTVAKMETAVEDAMADYEFQQLRKQIAQGVFRVGLSDRKVELGKQDIEWLDTLLKIAEQRYEVGEMQQADILRLQNEKAKRLNDIETDERNAEHDRVNLNKFVGRDLHSPFGIFHLPAVAAPVVYSPKLVKLAVQNEPKLNVYREEIRRAAAATEQAKRARYPDFSMVTEIRNYSGNGEFRQGMVGLSFNFPLGNRKRYDADIKREELKKKAAEFSAEDYERTVRDEVFHLTVQIDAARREALLYRDEIIPRSEAAMESARVAWESGRSVFRDVIDARRMLLEAQLMYAKAVAEQYEMMSELVLCCGLGDLEALQMIGAQLSQPSSK